MRRPRRAPVAAPAKPAPPSNSTTPKHRMVSVAPFRDRVVHHAFCAITEPIFERGFIHDTYANRKGKDSHRAIARYEKFRDRFRHVLRCDIYRYLPAINHAILKRDLRRRLACERTLGLADRIIDGSNPQEPVNLHFTGDDLFTPFERRRGLPIGNLTSQFFSNLYLDGFDHFCKEVLRGERVCAVRGRLRALPRRSGAARGVAPTDRAVPGGQAPSPSSGQDAGRACQRARQLPRVRPPARRPPPPPGGECPSLPQPSAGPAGPLAARERDPTRSRTTRAGLDCPRGACTDVATAPRDLQGGLVRPRPEA